MKKKLSLGEIKVKSFVTELNSNKVFGGAPAQTMQQPQCSGIIQCNTGITDRLCETINLACISLPC